MIALIIFILMHFVAIGDNPIKDKFKDSNGEVGCLLPMIFVIFIVIGAIIDILIGF